MAAPTYKEIPPACLVKACDRFSQVYSISGGNASFLKTCVRHTYKDLNKLSKE